MKSSIFNARPLLPLLLYLALILLCVFTVFSLRSRPNPDSPASLGPAAEKVRLENGMTFLFKAMPEAKVTSVRVLIKAGSIYEGRFLGYGISHLVEHMLFKGTDRFGMADMSRVIRELGGQHNAYTSFESMGFYITVPSVNTVQAASILANAVFHPRFDPGEMDKEKKVILDEIAMNSDDIDRWLGQELFAFCYDRHPYRWPVVGLAERFRTITRQNVLDYYASRYRPENIVFSIAGNFDKTAVMAAVMTEADRAAIVPASESVIDQEPRQLGYRFRQLTRPDATLTRVSFAWKSVDLHSPDLYALDVLSLMLGSGKPSILNRELKEKRQLVQDISSYSYTPRDMGLFGIDATLEDRNLRAVTNLVLKLIASLPRYLTRDNFNRAKNLILSGRVTSLQTVDGQSSSMASDELQTGDPDFSSTYIARVQSLTMNDLTRVFAKYLVRDQLSVLVVQPQPKNVRQQTNFSGPPGALKMESSVLRSGLRVLYIYKTNLPLLNLKFLVRGGILLDRDHPGIGRFVSDTLIKGNSKYPGLSAFKAVEAVGGWLQSYSGNSSAGVTVELLDKDAALGMDILYHEINDASFAGRDIENVRRNIVNTIDQQSEDMFSIGMNGLRRLMYSNHPYRYPAEGTIASVKGMRTPELRKFYKEHYSSADGLLIVTGRVTPALKRKIASVFGGVRRGRPSSLASGVPNLRPLTASLTFRTNLGKQQSLVLVGFPMPSITNASRYDIEVLAGALSGLGSRLFVRLRDIQHLGYQVGAGPRFMLDQGFFFFYVTTERPDEAEAGLMREIRALAVEPFSGQEISMSVNDLLGDYLTGEQAWDSIALNAGLYELYSGDYGKYFDYPAAITSVDAVRLRRISDSLFKGNERVVILRGGTR